MGSYKRFSRISVRRLEVEANFRGSLTRIGNLRFPHPGVFNRTPGRLFDNRKVFKLLVK